MGENKMNDSETNRTPVLSGFEKPPMYRRRSILISMVTVRPIEAEGKRRKSRSDTDRYWQQMGGT